MISAITLVFACLSASVAVVVLTPIAIHLARRVGFIDLPDTRKVHTTPTPLLGGLAVFCATLGVVFTVGKLSGFSMDLPRLGFFAGAIWMFLLGLADDRYGVSVPLKLLAQFVGAAFLVMTGNTDGLIGNSPIAIILCLVWVVGIVNAVNFLDGLDGLAAGTSFLACVAFAVVGLLGGQPYPALLAATGAGAALGFLRWNWNPARIFLGDAGSLFLGYLLASLGMMATWDKASFAYLLVPVIVLGVPIFDITFVVAVRLLEGRAIYKAGKDHTSHRLLFLLRSVPYSTLLLLTASMFLGAAGVGLAFAAKPLLMILATGGFVILFLYLGRRLSKVSTS